MPNKLSIRVLGGCDQGVIDQFEFYAGEARNFKFQIYDPSDNQRVCVPATNDTYTVIKTLTLPATTPADIEIEDSDITQSIEDPSIFSVDLTEDQIDILMTGFIKFTWSVYTGTPPTLTLVSSTVAYRELGIKKNTTA